MTQRLGGSRRALLFLSAVTAVVTFGMQLGRGTAVIIAVGALECACKTCSLTMADTCISAHCRTHGGNYGAFRSFGSLGYTLGGLALGFLAVAFTLERTLLNVTALCCALAFAAALFFPREDETARETPGAEPGISAGAALRLLAGNRRFRFLVFITLFSALTLDCNTNYIGNHLVVTLGAPESILSLNTACCVIPELLLLPLVSGKILPKYGFKRYYCFSAAVLVLRCAFYLAVRSPLLFVMGSLLHSVAIGCNPVAGLAYLGEVVPEKLYATAVAVLAACISVGRAGYGWLCGVLYEQWGSYAIFAALLVVNLISAIVIFTSRQFDEADAGYCRG